MLIPERYLLFHCKILYFLLTIAATPPFIEIKLTIKYFHKSTNSLDSIHIISIFWPLSLVKEGKSESYKGQNMKKRRKYTDPQLINRAVINSVTIHSNLPVTLPGMSYIVVRNGVFVRLLVQKVKHVLDGEWQRTSSVGRTENGLKEIVNKLL